MTYEQGLSPHHPFLIRFSLPSGTPRPFELPDQWWGVPAKSHPHPSLFAGKCCSQTDEQSEPHPTDSTKRGLHTTPTGEWPDMPGGREISQNHDWLGPNPADESIPRTIKTKELSYISVWWWRKSRKRMIKVHKEPQLHQVLFTQKRLQNSSLLDA